MTYTEIKKRNGRIYYYRVLSVRRGEKIGKQRKYLGSNLIEADLRVKEAEADKQIHLGKVNRTIEMIKSKIIPILKKNNIKKAGIFGSYSRGEQKKHSDIDIVIEPAKDMGFAFIGLQFELEKELNKKVDLITYKYTNQHLKKYILNDEVRIIG